MVGNVEERCSRRERPTSGRRERDPAWTAEPPAAWVGRPGSECRRTVMDVTRMLEADHREVEDLFAQIEKADGAERQPLVDKLAKSLLAHMQLEEAVVYPAIK